MKNFLKRVNEDGERWLLLWFYSFIVMVIFIEVVRRFVLSYSSVWGEETARYAFIYLVWIGASAAVRDLSEHPWKLIVGRGDGRVAEEMASPATGPTDSTPAPNP